VCCRGRHYDRGVVTIRYTWRDGSCLSIGDWIETNWNTHCCESPLDCSY
jgi:hypothetical protein